MSSQIAIELNDNGVIVSDDQKLLLESPGYIINLPGQEWVGDEARNRAQLYPNECNNRFWFKLAHSQVGAVDQDNAKLALAHLASVWQQVSSHAESVILTVPASFTKTGLGLLLGICKELAIPVCAMIHQAVLVPRQSNHSGMTIHLDMQLHHTAITLLQEQNNEFNVSTVKRLDGIGFASIYVTAAAHIAQVFINDTRLDPMHSAELEQQLFNFLPAWLEQAQRQDVVQCQLHHQSSHYEASVNAHSLKETLKPQLNKIIETLLSFDSNQAAIACVPEIVDRQLGFNQCANNHGVMVRKLSLGYHAQQSLLHAKKLINNDGQVYLIKKLPFITLTDPLPAVSDLLTQPVQQATHILYRHHAYSIGDILCLVDEPGADLQLQSEQPNELQNKLLVIRKISNQWVVEIINAMSVEVNNQEIQSPAQVSIGDCIRTNAGEHELTLIRVQP